jgi:hypothetical protein
MLRLIKAIGNEETHYDRADLNFLLDKFTENIVKYDEKSSHRIAYTVAAVLLFVLLDQSVVQSFSFFGITVSKLATLKAFIPPVAIYFALSCLVIQASRRQSEEIAESIIKRQFADLWMADLEEFLIPHPIIRTIAVIGKEVEGMKRFLAVTTSMFLAIPTLFAVLLFYIYSSYVLYRDSNLHSILFWCSLTASTVFALQFLAVFWIFSGMSDEADQSQVSPDGESQESHR